jgi:TfoX/Sxy family transcriptional regulator of competence genes
MGSSIDTVQFICDQAGLGARLTYRKMFGEYGLYVDGKIVALVCNDQLFLKPTPEAKAFLGEMPEAPPYPGCKPFPLLGGVLDDPERLKAALEITASVLPEPKPKMKKARKKAKAAVAKAKTKPPTKKKLPARKKK